MKNKPVHECVYYRVANEVKIVFDVDDTVYTLEFDSNEDALAFVDGLSSAIYDYCVNGQTDKERLKKMFINENDVLVCQ